MNINFTHEMQTADGLNFLDLNLKIIAEFFSNSNSFHPTKLKVNNI